MKKKFTGSSIDNIKAGKYYPKPDDYEKYGLKPISDSLIIKKEFEDRYKGFLSDDYKRFIIYTTSFMKRSFRINTLKAEPKKVYESLSKTWDLKKIPWCDLGYWIDGERRDIGNSIEHQLGLIYVQEAASMIPPIVLDPKEGETVLDMSAAPGSKTTQMSALMNNKGLIIANEVSLSRMRILDFNLQRCGVYNAVVTKYNGFSFPKIEFDKILLDAPCSGTGTIRKSPRTLLMWNPKSITALTSLQRGLVRKCFEMLRPGGEMVYSTCSTEPEEDEGIVNFILSKYENADVVPIELNIKRGKIIEKFDSSVYDERVKGCLRIYPQDNNTEGFFVAKIKKLG